MLALRGTLRLAKPTEAEYDTETPLMHDFSLHPLTLQDFTLADFITFPFRSLLVIHRHDLQSHWVYPRPFRQQKSRLSQVWAAFNSCRHRVDEKYIKEHIIMIHTSSKNTDYEDNQRA